MPAPTTATGIRRALGAVSVPRLWVKIVERWAGADPLPDAMVALHARRSAESIQQFRRLRPAGRLLLALTGTDVYRDIHDDDAARLSLALADRLVVLQPRALDELDAKSRIKAGRGLPVGVDAEAINPFVAAFSTSSRSAISRHEKDPFTPDYGATPPARR